MTSLEVEEIKIPVPWGHIAGKWWGPKDIRPIVAFHGREDNAGSFDRIISMLPNHLSYLAIDLPGHGYSSNYNDGDALTIYTVMNTFNLILDIFQWNKISLMTHSLSAMACYFWLPCIKEKVDLYIAIDGLKPHVRSIDFHLKEIKINLDSWLITNKRSKSIREPPSFTYDELLQKYVNPAQPLLTKESADYIVRRGVNPSKLHPGKFYFSRDRRIKAIFYPPLSQSDSLDLAKYHKFPFCLIRTTRSFSGYPNQTVYWGEIIQVMQQENQQFECHAFPDSDHYIHLSEPHRICGILCDFINKYRPPTPVDVVESKL